MSQDKRIGNRFWEARSSHGRKPIFQDEEQLWQACLEYFEWVEDNPLKEEKVSNKVRLTVNKMRAMTLGGLYIFLDITENTWANYRESDNLKEVCAKVDNIIRTQKFEGAAADLLNGNIIARDLGLSDKQDVDVRKKVSIIDLTGES